jgi:hypothetical protein
LARGNNTADGVHDQLLHDALHWRSEHLQLRPLLGLDHILGQTRSLLLGLAELLEPGAAKFGSGLGASFAQSCDGGLGFPVFALLQKCFLLQSDKILKLRQIGQLGTQILVVKVFANMND